MPDDTVFYSGEWWTYEASDSEPAAVEIERTEPNEIAISLRGRSGSDDHGTLYVTPTNARRIARVLLDEATDEREAAAALTKERP